ncbi:MAG: DMT family transporter [Deltaproteobacteria bacterium]|nr:DMT family transporter [Deltaproteobacteria bacterium]
MGFKEWGLIIILSILWGGSFFFVGVAVKEVPPLTIVFCRVGLASIILLGIVYLKGDKMPASPSLWGGFIILGVLNNLIPFSLIVWGQTHIESGLASILNATTPIFSVVLAHLLTREERLTTNRVSGVLIGWIGVTVLIGRRFKDLSPLVVATGMLCSSTIMMTPLALIIDQPWNLSPSVMTLMALFGLAAISTSLAYIIYFRVLATSGPTNILLVTFLIPLSAILLGVTVLGERLGWNAFVGMGMIFIGLIAIDGRLIKRFMWKNVWYYEI